MIFAISTIIYCHEHTFLHKNIFIEIFVTINKIKCLREKNFNIKIKIYRISVFFIWKKEICRARRFNIYIKRLKLSTFTKNVDMCHKFQHFVIKIARNKLLFFF